MAKLRLHLFAVVSLIAASGCAAPFGLSKAAPPPSQRQLDSLAVSFLDSIQAGSIAERREFCGFFVQNRKGVVKITDPTRGTFASCRLPQPIARSRLVANYHTHGAYGEFYDNEVPSLSDMKAAEQLGMDGYMSTPGGRVWHLDHALGIASQICGLGCVTSDPNFLPRNESAVLPRYTLDQLAWRTERSVN